MANKAYLSLGSNIEPELNIKSAVKILAERARLVAVSSVWETQPLGLAAQPNFLNAAAIVETGLSAAQLKQQVLAFIEQALGRVRQASKNAPRQIDIDIILFNEEVFELGQRHIPDRELFERAFVAIPLAEIAPDYIHPETGQSLREIAQQFETTSTTMLPRSDVSWALAQFVSY
jgi:2-amino-4-hydroxy-6-hydroxymethyldihydropteridine diphosphokinase